WKGISAGYQFSVGILHDGSLWAWGDNSYGQLADGTKTQSVEPVREVSGSPWSFASAGRQHAIAIRNDGTAWVWGANWYGQLGDGTMTDSPVPLGLTF
ncbi:MAG TPA: RCC1 repeat-containing protein, partial [Deltaproteobacteria bacterium]|nr:RCC1 repeat-containing protein [Deltaproteobacteria bacterium]